MTVRRHFQRCDFGSEIRRQMPGTWPRRHFSGCFCGTLVYGRSPNPEFAAISSFPENRGDGSPKWERPYRQGLGGEYPKQAGFWAVFAKFHEDLRLNGHCRYSQMWKIECTKGHYYFTGFTLL